MNNKIFAKVEYTGVNGGCTQSSERIIKETALTISINGDSYATAMILAGLEKEYVFGHLFAQGIIRRGADIRSLTIKYNTAEVILQDNISKEPALKKTSPDFKVSRDDVFTCVRAILKSDIFAETEAVHSAGLFLEGKEPVCITEDLGRHHALDKVVGYGLLHDIDFTQTLAASTGRQPLEMILKCRNACIPIIATKGVPTTLAIEIAEKAGITIAGLVRGKTMMVYSHPERIE
jgi:FdhD protein